MHLYGSKDIETWLTDTLGHTRRENKVCIVGVVGKSSMLYGSSKIDVFNANVLKRQAFKVDREGKCNIDAYFDGSSDTVYLHVTGFQDINTLELLIDDTDEQSFHDNIGQLDEELSRSILYVFLLSHIVVVVEPACRFDTSYIRYLRHLNFMREETMEGVCEALSAIPNLPKNWALNGRFCSPRLLFLFENGPVRPDMGYTKKKEMLQKMSSSLEDQIYSVFRKSRVITNNSNQSICAVPENDHFALVIAQSQVNSTRPERRLILDLFKTITSKDVTTESTTEDIGQDNNELGDFIMSHIDTAHSVGFNDNVGRGTPSAVFELPKLKYFVRGAAALRQYLLLDPESVPGLTDCNQNLHIEKVFSDRRCAKVLPLAVSKYQDGLPNFYSNHQHQAQLAAAVQSLCALARGPALQQAIIQLREECTQVWKNGREACEALSLTGNNCMHRVFEQYSTNLLCLLFVKYSNGLHRVPDDEDVGDSTHVMLHASSARYLNTCNCGHKQELRDDPFDVKEANYDFYQSNVFYCCQTLDKFQFPVFVPPDLDGETSEINDSMDNDAFPPLHSLKISTQSQDDTGGGSTGGDFLPDRDNRPLNKISGSGQDLNVGSSESVIIHETMNTQDGDTEGSASLAESDLALDHLMEDEAYLQNTGGDEYELNNSGPEEIMLDPDAQIFATRDYAHPIKGGLKESVSTAVLYKKYVGQLLEGMPHSQCIPGLLPLFPSWSLLCLGSSTLYTHATGLRDQPNFSHGSQYLLPFDVPLKVDNEKWFTAMESMSTGQSNLTHKRLKSKKGTADNVWVKLFVGFEYECPRGHRFMLQSPTKMLKHSGAGGPKDSGSCLIKNDLPLWIACSCRSQPPLNGQLMRIHVVTPKAPVTVSLNPRVQPSNAQSLIIVRHHIYFTAKSH